MKHFEKYESPSVEVIEVEVESGFISSGEDSTPEDGYWDTEG